MVFSVEMCLECWVNEFREAEDALGKVSEEFIEGECFQGEFRFFGTFAAPIFGIVGKV